MNTVTHQETKKSYLKNCYIKKLKGKTDKDYFIIFDRERIESGREKAYFCFPYLISSQGWKLLVDNYLELNQLEIDYLEKINQSKITCHITHVNKVIIAT